MVNDSPEAVPSAPECPYPFPPTPPPESDPPFPTDPANLEANGAPPPGTPSMLPYPPPLGMFCAFPTPPQSQSPSTPSSASRPKRSQVKIACTNCAQACKRCDDQRPCLWCQKYSMTDTAGPEWVPAPLWRNGPPPAPAAAAPSAPAPPAPPASAAAPQPFSAPPEGYPYPFYPPMGFFLGPPPPPSGAEEGAAPVPYFYLYPPLGMYPPPVYPPPVQATVPAAADTKKAEEEKWKRGKGKTNGVNAVGTNEVNGNGASADAGEGATNRKDAEGADADGERAGTPEEDIQDGVPPDFSGNI
ncbi:hypothetical protein B0H11DRAFT_2352993 [Mycena galericulata]|nr:hypothetical protein B0H11DRAFT_2352993 [Mycena galericulata]